MSASIPPGDVVALTRALVRVDSRNPALEPDAPGEGQVARLLADVLSGWGFDVEMQEAAPGRPNVVATAGPTGAPSLMLNGHLDTVGTSGMTHPPLDAEEHDGKMYGRGSADMKGGVAAMCAAAARAHSSNSLRRRVIITAVIDEEYESLGTRAVIASGMRADAAIVTEPTRLAIAPAHRGFAWTEVTINGRAAHGSRYDIGVDAISLAGLLLAELDEFQRGTLDSRTHPLLGHASLHAGTIQGGSAWSIYPEKCVLRLERRTLPGESSESALQEIQDACARVKQRRPKFAADVALCFAQSPSDVQPGAPIVASLERAISECGFAPRIEGLSAWTDAALLNEAGIPAICYGPGDISLAHSDTEWVPVAELEQATNVLEKLLTID